MCSKTAIPYSAARSLSGDTQFNPLGRCMSKTTRTETEIHSPNVIAHSTRERESLQGNRDTLSARLSAPHPRAQRVCPPFFLGAIAVHDFVQSHNTLPSNPSRDAPICPSQKVSRRQLQSSFPIAARQTHRNELQLEQVTRGIASPTDAFFFRKKVR